MFSSALKSFSSNITSNYTLSSTASTYSGPWKIYDAKKKSTGKAVSVFTFDKKCLEPQSGLARSGVSLKKAHEEVIERLKKEATSLARLRHPSILELVEPVEETRNGGLMFATEPVTASLAGLLTERDAQEKAGGVGGRTSRYVIEDTEGGGRRRREIELDDLELQKGLLQIGKGLEFLHESAGLVHANLTPEAVYVNAKGDWKISGLGFSGAPDSSTSSVPPISLSEILNHDSRLPRFVQLNLDYTSPDFVMDSNVTASADLFSLGLLIVALFNSPHTSPLQTNSSISTYKRLLNTPSTTPSPSNQFLSSRPLPKELVSSVLPRLITRRPAQRMTAREFQESQYFDNILVSTLRFLDSLPAKSPNEKSQFMRGLSRVLSQFPKSVLEKKLLPALLEEMKDRDLLALILQNVFQTTKMLPSGRRAFTEKVTPRLREVFLTGPPPSTVKGVAPERDLAKEAGLMTILQNITTVTENCSGKEFKDDILPIILLAMESPTHPLVDASLRCIPSILPVLDYTTTRNDLFPVVTSVFSKTSSLGIKVRGLEAFVILCGGKPEGQDTSSDGLDGFGTEGQSRSKSAGNAVLDKYTVQDKIVPLLKAIKTKEPAVMMAALNVFKQIGKIADTDFIALEVLPIVWAMSLGPLLDLEQFRAFMDLIKSLSSRVEQEQIRKLQELSSSANSGTRTGRNDDIMSFGAVNGSHGTNGVVDGAEVDFERLVSGGGGGTGNNVIDGMQYAGRTGSGSNSSTLGQTQQSTTTSNTPPVFSWSTPSPTANPQPFASSLTTTATTKSQAPTSRTITPDLSGFAALTPSRGTTSPGITNINNTSTTASTPGFNWSNTSSTFPPPSSLTSSGSNNTNPWTNPHAPTNPAATTATTLAFNHPIPTAPSNPNHNILSSFSIPPPPSSSSFSSTGMSTRLSSNTAPLGFPPSHASSTTAFSAAPSLAGMAGQLGQLGQQSGGGSGGGIGGGSGGSGIGDSMAGKNSGSGSGAGAGAGLDKYQSLL